MAKSTVQVNSKAITISRNARRPGKRVSSDVMSDRGPVICTETQTDEIVE
jgi:hypothetical protein